MSPYKRGFSAATGDNHGLNIIANISHASSILKFNIKLSLLTFLIIHLSFPFLLNENSISTCPYRVDHLLLSGQFVAISVPGTFRNEFRLATVRTLQDKNQHREGE